MAKASRPRQQVEVDPHFQPTELLFRRFHPHSYDGHELGLDAIALPDMSVNREKYSAAADAIRGFPGWGVAEVQVQHVPRELLHLGTQRFEFRVVHAPLTHNRAHSEIRAFVNDAHVNLTNQAQLLDHSLHIRWRFQLMQRMRVRIRPTTAAE